MSALNGKRWCYYVPASGFDSEAGQFIPSIVVEGEPGHRPLSGDPDKLQTPWYWGPDMKTANLIASQANERLGLTLQEVEAILTSSMTAALAERGARRYA